MDAVRVIVDRSKKETLQRISKKLQESPVGGKIRIRVFEGSSLRRENNSGRWRGRRHEKSAVQD